MPKKLFVSGLAGDTSKKDFEAYFSELLGEELSILIPRNEHNPQFCQGFGIVTLASESLLKTLLEARAIQFKERLIHFTPYFSQHELDQRRQEIVERRIFITSPMLRHLNLFEIFTQFGEVEDAYIIRDSKKGTPLNYGFILFEHTSAAKSAVKQGTIVVGNTFVRACRFTQKNEKKQKQQKKKTIKQSMKGSQSIYRDEAHYIGVGRNIYNSINILGTNVNENRGLDPRLSSELYRGSQNISYPSYNNPSLINAHIRQNGDMEDVDKMRWWFAPPTSKLYFTKKRFQDNPYNHGAHRIRINQTRA